MDFILFLLVNVALFLRPQDLVPALGDWQIYNVLIVANLLLAAPAIAAQLGRGIRRAPATAFVVGVIAAATFSLAVRADWDGVWHWGIELAKCAAYFLLMTAVLTTAKRLSIYLAAIVTLTSVLAALAVLHFHGQIELAAITHAHETIYDTVAGASQDAYRLAAFGVFADPNDLSMIVVMSMLICAGGIFYRRLGMARFALVVPVFFLGYALSLTQSRGGFLALVVGTTALSVARFGWARSGLVIAILIPVLLSIYTGRQSDFSGSIARGTGGGRTDLWHLGLQMIKWFPLTGVGHGQFVQEAGLAAHNSYLQALAEWGLIGGMTFIGLFYVVLLSVWRLKPVQRQIRSRVMRTMQPFVMGALAAYAASMLTLTRCDVVPTYLVAGLGASFAQVAQRGTPLAPLTLSHRLLAQVALVTLGFIVFLYVYVRFVYRMFL